MAQETQKGLYIKLEGWDGEGDGREVQKEGVICIPMADSCWGLYYILHLLIYSLMDTWVVSTFWLLLIMLLYKHGCTDIFSSSCFQFSDSTHVVILWLTFWDATKCTLHFIYSSQTGHCWNHTLKFWWRGASYAESRLSPAGWYCPLPPLGDSRELYASVSWMEFLF